MNIIWSNRRLWMLLAAPLSAALMLVAMLAGLGNAGKATAAPIQDDARGQWSDTFADSGGLSAAVNVTVNSVQARLELEPAIVVSQTDWGGGAGHISATATLTGYATGLRVNSLISGNLSLGFTLPISDHTKGLEQDGYPDLVVSNYYSGNMPGVGTYYGESYIYYGSDSGYTDTLRASLPVTAAGGTAIADLNNDGFLDIVISRDGYFDGGIPDSSYVFWGSGDGYSASDRDELPSDISTCTVAADLDQDGYQDIVICNYSFNYTTFITNSYIYWGSSGGPHGVMYSTTRRTSLPTVGAVAAYAADFNKDGYLDLLFSNYQNSLNKNLTTTFVISSYIYWGGAITDVYTVTNRTELPHYWRL